MFLLCFYRMTSRQKANTSCYISMLLRSQPFLTNCVEALPQTLMPQFSQRTFHVLLLFQSLVHISISLIRELSPYSTSKYNQEERNMSDMSNSKLETTFFLMTLSVKSIVLKALQRPYVFRQKLSLYHQFCPFGRFLSIVTRTDA